MFKLGKSFLALLLAFSIAFLGFSTLGQEAQAAEAISLKIDGEAVSVSQPPVLKSGKVLVPLRDVFTKLGAKVKPITKDKTVIATKGSTTIQVKIGSKAAKVNKKNITLEVAPQIINSKAMVPVKFVTDAFGAKVIYNSHSNSVSVISTTVQKQKASLTIAAAASLTDALNDLEKSFAKEYPNVKLTFTFGGSGKLATQIQQGAPVDVFLSAAKKDMDTLQNDSLLVKNSRVNFAANQLVLIAAKDTKLPSMDFDKMNLDKVKQFALGNSDTVPVGRYTQETFTTLKIWDKVKAKAVYGSDVRQVLTYVETGNAELGVVYSTDAISSDKVKILGIAKEEWHSPIVYPGAVLTDSKYKTQADMFLDYLNSDKGITTLKKYGFK